MSLLRAAFECDDGKIELVVLCVGCYSEFATRLNDRRRWTRPLEFGTCTFCEAEIRSAVLS